MKRLLSLLVLTAILFTWGAFPAAALRNPGLGNPPDGAPTVLVAVDPVKADPNYPYIKKLIMLEADEPLDSRLLPAGYFYLDTEGNTQGVEILWDVSAPELAEPGLHEVVGVPDPAKLAARGLVLADGFAGTVTWPIWRSGGDEPLAASLITACPIERPLLPIGGDPAALEFDFTNWNFSVGRDGFLKPDLDWAWSWDYSAVDTTKPGRYTITGRLLAPDRIALPNDNTVTLTVYVMPDDGIALTAPISTSPDGWLELQWLYPADAVTEPVLEQQLADGSWTACSPDWYAYRASGKYLEAALRLQLLRLPTETPLTLRLRYRDNGTERLSDPISLTVPANIADLLHTDRFRLPDELGFGGDRDGGDSGGTPLPDLEQTLPWPTAPVNPLAAPGLFTLLVLRKEIVTDNYTAISGLRLRRLLDDGETVLFEKSGVAVELPTDRLTALRMGYYDMLKVTIRRPTDDTVQLAVTVNSQAVTDLSGTVIRLPWDTVPETELVCRDPGGKHIADAVYEPASATVCFTVNAPGTFVIEEADA